MKLVLHIFRKDTRHLWPAVVLSLALFASLAEIDRERVGPNIGSAEEGLNLLLPLAWACLVGLAVLDEPLTGERQFWLTRPHRWPVLLGAKLLFALLFVHLPLLLADSYVLAAHGFSPFACLPQLLTKQLLVAGAVTLPAIALAALVGGFTHFIMLLFAVVAMAMAVSYAPFDEIASFQRPDSLRGDLAAGIAAIAAIAIVGLRYRRRQPAFARGLGIMATLLVGTLFAYVPESFDYRLRAALHPGYPLTLRIENRKQDFPLLMTRYTAETVAVPVVLAGVPAGALTHFGAVDLTLSTPDGSSYRSTNYTGDPQYGRLHAAALRFPQDRQSAPVTLLLQMERSLYERLKNQKVRARGRLDVAFHRVGETTWMPMHGQVNAPGIGHCSSSLAETRWSENAIDVLCESPSPLSRSTRVTLAIPGIERIWDQRLVTRRDQVAGPHWAWLSTLNRGQAFFPTADSRTRVYKFGVEAPLESIDKAKIGVTPEIATGYTGVYFDLPDLSLANYRVRPQSER